MSEQATTILLLGHVDQGKTTLACAITQADYGAVNLGVEETCHGARYQISRTASSVGGRRFIWVDAPARTDLMKALLSGAVRADGFVLVSSSARFGDDDREMASVARRLGIPLAGVALNKCDLVDDGLLLDIFEMEETEQLADDRYEDVVPVRISASGALHHDPKWAHMLSDFVSGVAQRIPPTTVPLVGSDGKEFAAFAYMLASDEGGRRKPHRVGQFTLRFGTREVSGSVRVNHDDGMWMPGDVAELEVQLAETMALAVGQTFQVLESGHLIAVGRVASH
jgi:translation elongation factor EF-Tu-like GTPase